MNRFPPIRATPVNVGHMDRPLVPPTHDGSRIAIEIGNSAAGSHAEEPATFREPSGEQKRIAVGWGLHPYQVAADALGTRNASIRAESSRGCLDQIRKRHRTTIIGFESGRMR